MPPPRSPSGPPCPSSRRCERLPPRESGAQPLPRHPPFRHVREKRPSLPDHLTARSGAPDLLTDVRVDAIVDQHHVDLIERADDHCADQPILLLSASTTTSRACAGSWRARGRPRRCSASSGLLVCPGNRLQERLVGVEVPIMSIGQVLRPRPPEVGRDRQETSSMRRPRASAAAARL